MVFVLLWPTAEHDAENTKFNQEIKLDNKDKVDDTAKRPQRLSIFSTFFLHCQIVIGLSFF